MRSMICYSKNQNIVNDLKVIPGSRKEVPLPTRKKRKQRLES